MKQLVKAIMLSVVAALTLASCTRIDAGHEGVMVKQYGSEKGVQDATLVTGRVWYNPFTTDVVEVPLFMQTADYEAFKVNAKDGSVFTVDPTISYRIQTGKSPQIYTKYRKDVAEITNTTLLNYVKDAFRIQMNAYTTDELISNRQEFENAVQNTLDSTFKKEGFILEQLTSGLGYPESIVRAINAKNEAVQQAMKVENELRVAEAQAKKKLVEAEADAKANALRERTLTPLLIQQQFIDKWDGKTPLYGSSPTFFKHVQ